MRKFYFVQRFKKINGVLTDIGTVDIEDKFLKDTLQQNPDWKVIGDTGEEVPAPAFLGGTPVSEDPATVPEIQNQTLTGERQKCPICGKDYKNLAVHKRVHAKT